MSDEKYYAILTDLGQQLITAAYQAGEVVTITQMAFGDAGQTYVAPDPTMTALVSQTAMLPLVRGPQEEDIIGGGVDILSDDYPDSWVYEAGLFDADGNLIIYASYPPTLIPPSTDSVKKGLSLDIGLIMSATENITVYVDPAIEALTRAVADGLYLQILNNLSEIANAGNVAQQAAQKNLGLKTGAVTDVQTDEVDVTPGHILLAGNWHLSKGIRFVPLLTQASLYPGVFAIDGGANQDMVFSDAHFGTEVGKYIYEGTVRVYSPNNPPPATDLSAYMKTADANAKFVQGIRQGTQGGMTIKSDQDVFAPDGSYAMGYHAEGENPGGDTMYYRALQANVNGTWSTIGYNTASPNPLVAVSDIPHAGISRLSNLKMYRPDEDWPEYLMNFIDDAGYPWHLASQVLEGNVFIAYDSAGVIQQIDTDATMLTPQNLSVAGLASVPDGCHINGAWKFDGEAVYLDSGIASAETLWVNTAKYNALAGRAVTFIAMINASAALGNSRDGDSDKLLALQQYADQLRDVDLSQAKPEWPVPPSFIQ